MSDRGGSASASCNRRPGRARAAMRMASSPRGEIIFLAGQIGWDTQGRFAEGLAAQVGQALANIVTLLAEAGAGPQHIVRLTWYVTDLSTYRASLSEVGAAYRAIFGRHFPTMSVIGVPELVEQQALVEIEATAVLPDGPAPGA